jgi:hypothetical protein
MRKINMIVGMRKIIPFARVNAARGNDMEIIMSESAVV